MTPGRAIALAVAGDTAAARAECEDALRRTRNGFGPDHSATLGLAATLTLILVLQNLTEQARALGEETVARARRRLEGHTRTRAEFARLGPPDHPECGCSGGHLAGPAGRRGTGQHPGRGNDGECPKPAGPGPPVHPPADPGTRAGFTRRHVATFSQETNGDVCSGHARSPTFRDFREDVAV